MAGLRSVGHWSGQKTILPHGRSRQRRSRWLTGTVTAHVIKRRCTRPPCAMTTPASEVVSAIHSSTSLLMSAMSCATICDANRRRITGGRVELVVAPIALCLRMGTALRPALWMSALASQPSYRHSCLVICPGASRRPQHRRWPGSRVRFASQR